jgi:hypothetical protein
MMRHAARGRNGERGGMNEISSRSHLAVMRSLLACPPQVSIGSIACRKSGAAAAEGGSGRYPGSAGTSSTMQLLITGFVFIVLPVVGLALAFLMCKAVLWGLGHDGRARARRAPGAERKVPETHRGAPGAESTSQAPQPGWKAAAS